MSPRLLCAKLDRLALLQSAHVRNHLTRPVPPAAPSETLSQLSDTELNAIRSIALVGVWLRLQGASHV